MLLHKSLLVTTMIQYIPYFQGFSASISEFVALASIVGMFEVGTLIVDTFVGTSVIWESNSFVGMDSVEPRRAGGPDGAGGAVDGRAGSRALCPWTDDDGADVDMVSKAFVLNSLLDSEISHQLYNTD